uniref:Uncharacterized protein n=1 Tax=Mustela putorius furo TaxID=9669 RepID=M3XUU4_MUSPF
GEGESLPAAAATVARERGWRSQLPGKEPPPGGQRDPSGAGVDAPPWAEVLLSSCRDPSGRLCRGSRTLDKVIRPVWLPLPPVQVEHQLALDLALLTSCSSCPDLSWGSAVRVWVQGLETWPRGPGRLHAGVTRVGTGAVPPASGSQGPGRRLLRLPTGAGWAARQEEWASHVPAKVAENQVGPAGSFPGTCSQHPEKPNKPS